MEILFTFFLIMSVIEKVKRMYALTKTSFYENFSFNYTLKDLCNTLSFLCYFIQKFI